MQRGDALRADRARATALHRGLQIVAALVLAGVVIRYVAAAASMGSGGAGVLDAIGLTAAVGASLLVGLFAGIGAVAHAALTSWLVDPERGVAHVLGRHLAVVGILAGGGVLAWAFPWLVPG